MSEEEEILITSPQAAKKDSKGAKGLKDSLAGTISGAACLFAGHPFDTVKVRMQTQGDATGAISTLTKTVSDEGILALYKGVTSPLVGMMFETAVLFVVYGQLKIMLQKDPNVPLTLKQYSIAGGLSGIATSFVLTPVELVKCRLQIQRNRLGDVTAAAAMKYKGPWDCLVKTVKEQGIKGIFRGLGPTLAREVPGNMAFFGSYEAMKQILTPEGKSTDELSIPRLVLAGGLGGVAYWSTFYPADVAKSRIQTTETPLSLFGCLRQIYAKEGVRGLYRGYIPTVIRAFPANAVMFSVYELLSRLLAKL